MLVGSTGDAVAAVAEGGADLGLVDLPFAHAGVRVEALHHSLAHCLMRSDHMLAGLGRITPRDLAGAPGIALTRRFAVRADAVDLRGCDRPGDRAGGDVG